MTKKKENQNQHTDVTLARRPGLRSFATLAEQAALQLKSV